ncbi:MAG: thiol:disulfide interchange protein DsbA/DsbL [Rubrivivax sp.]|nr:thiol:disulfide interchange protein DsbA/DsbL [Rubrivivax sp.]
MKSWRARFFALLFAAAGLLSACAGLDSTTGTDYLRLDPAQPVATGEKIEVIEFFSYSCPHCFALYPRVKAWAQGKPADVTFRYQPVIFRDSWEVPARLHFTLLALGEVERLGDAVFDAIQLEQLDFGNEPVLFDWAARQGLDRQRFIAAYRSPEVARQLAQVRPMAQSYQLPGVPALVVDGKYLTTNSLSGSAQGTIDALDRLVKVAREERAKRR